ncbi:MAG: T9SS type A sorting domain-containing protein [Flavobacteriales bacterium]|nr:T9SS type A sorting domain-containing protein [Flavobacteriales bacterium]MCW8913218.1 T9SS type A sorting domain-containing protein [Flavobacteriales bacterium]MCW8937373.1 T9SS type A sorting domain-containing protein [Flavobacteriales bacterium]MCW8940484.1 T9SS type A sorting domain-containing protein [Flavobacteriales bacterium]MCW8969349.1 T9SS type A sorting domain-containing protein [Flavobacteriales bacterium]
MKKLYFILAILFSQLAVGQNQAPVAVNDTFYVYHNDSVTRYSIHFTSNDINPNNNPLQIDTLIYTGNNFLLQQHSSIHISYIYYKPQSNFKGWDTIQYIVSDYNQPTLKDTGFIFVFVMQKNYEILDLNNVKARIELNTLFGNMTEAIAGFEVPKGSGRNTIFAANPWVVGKNNDTVYANTITFGDFSGAGLKKSIAGPISDNYPKHDFHLKWDRVWKVTNVDLQYHIANWFYPNYQPPQVFLDWPAHGDTTNGQAFYLAPFIDKNNDGIYNPYDGDYPQFKGQQAIYFIRNDMREQLVQEPMESEIHGMAYVYDCPSDSALNHTVFLDLTIYNRSNKTYDSTYIGLFTDFDIGNPEDDYVGCDVDRSTFYGYNGDAFDEDGGFGYGYGNYIPYQGVTFLKGAKQDDDGIDNAFGIAPYETINGYGFGDGIIDNEHWGMEHFLFYHRGGGQFSGDGEPIINLDFFYYLSGKWRDSTPFVYGGNGHSSSGGTVPAKYMFPDASDTYHYGTGGVAQAPWSEFNAQPGGTPNSGYDKRGMGSTGPFSFAPQQSVELTMAFVSGIDYTTQGNLAGLLIMQERVDSIRSYFLNDFQSVCGDTLINSINDDVERTEKQLVIYPNPFNNQFTVEYETENQSAYLAIYNLMGVKVAEQIINSTKTVVDVSNISNGIYFVVIQDGNNRLHHKIVKK